MSEEKNLLVDRLKEHGIPLPICQPAFDRIYVAEISAPERLPGSEIYVPVDAKMNASRGIIIAAGLGALDHMYAHGVALGHVIWYARLSPWVRHYQGTDLRSGKGAIGKAVILRSSEIVGSEDTMAALQSGAMEILGPDADGRHSYTDRSRNDPPENDEGI